MIIVNTRCLETADPCLSDQLLYTQYGYVHLMFALLTQNNSERNSVWIHIFFKWVLPDFTYVIGLEVHLLQAHI